MDKPEINYEIHDKEMLAIIAAYKQWRRYLERAAHLVMVYTDYKNQEYFTTSKVLNRRQVCWAQEVAEYEFEIAYRPGSSNGKPDALSRRSEYHPEKGGVGSKNQPISRVIRPDQLIGRLSDNLGEFSFQEDDNRIVSSVKLQAIPPVQFAAEFLERVVIAANSDTEWQEEYYRAMNGEPRADVTYIHGSLYYKGRLWIPDNDDLRKEVCEEEHDSKVAGHMGQDKTVELIRRNFFWPRMNPYIEDYVRSCDSCQRNKAARHVRYGLLQPLELAYAPWQSISMDFITDLPESNGCPSIWVIVDRFTKMAHFIPLRKNQTKGADLAPLFLQNIWRLHGIPTDIVSDRDTRFTSQFWSELARLLGIRQR